MGDFLCPGRYVGAWIAAGRGELIYQKPPPTLDQLVDRLAGRGLGIPDPDRARKYLQHIGYYRLSKNMTPFKQGGPEHVFRGGAVLDDVLDLCVFDRTLRLLVMDAVERREGPETAVRGA